MRPTDRAVLSAARRWRVLTCALSLAVALGGAAVAAPQANTPAAVSPAATATPVTPPTHAIYHATRTTDGARNYYAGVYGITNLRVQMTSSDNLVKFTWKVIDPKKAAPVGDRGEKPEMVALRSNAVLQVPTMEKVGPLRQTNLHEAGKEYWMLFSNKGHPVRSGDRVNVIIGTFRALDLVVE